MIRKPNTMTGWLAEVRAKQILEEISTFTGTRLNEDHIDFAY
jgi:hypothetical protein